MATNTTEWSWIGKSRRHTLRLTHQILTGKQDILLNDVSVLSTGWRFRLTGTIQIPADDSVLELYLLADGACTAPPAVTPAQLGAAPASRSLSTQPLTLHSQSGASCTTSSQWMARS